MSDRINCSITLPSPINLETRNQESYYRSHSLVTELRVYDKIVEDYHYNRREKRYDLKGERPNFTFNQYKWNLEQFHFHAKSDHTFDGKYYPLELHFVLTNYEGSTKTLLALGVVYSVAKHTSSELAAIKADKPFSLKKVIEKRFQRYFTYDGSLTSPPNETSVIWLVARCGRVSKEDLEYFKKYAQPSYPLQDRGGRNITVCSS